MFWMKVLKLIWFPCTMNLCLLKIEIKENISKVILLSLKKTVLKENLEKMNQLRKHILFFDFLENHCVSKDEVSKQHLNVIKKSNFVRSSHPPLETILITCQKKWRSPLSKLLMIKLPLLVLLNRTTLLMNLCILLVNNLTALKKKLLKKCFCWKTCFRKICFCQNWKTFDWSTQSNRKGEFQNLSS